VLCKANLRASELGEREVADLVRLAAGRARGIERMGDLEGGGHKNSFVLACVGAGSQPVPVRLRAAPYTWGAEFYTPNRGGCRLIPRRRCGDDAPAYRAAGGAQ